MSLLTVDAERTADGVDIRIGRSRTRIDVHRRGKVLTTNEIYVAGTIVGAAINVDCVLGLGRFRRFL